uniref:Uncharacterized protein n=1 Tax=Kalanchoe fedtschenkoi TaxID=63787 RepID=A0A7N1A553_KALFE
MGCFLACFGCTKKRKRLKSARTSLIPHDAPHPGLGSYQPLESASVTLDVKEISACHVAGSDLKKEKATLGSALRARKKVSFNLNVRTYDLINSQDYSQRDVEEEKNEEKIGHPEIKDKEESTTTSYPSNYRYKDFVDCEEEDEAEYSDDSDVDEEDNLYDDCLEDREDGYGLGGDGGLDTNNAALDHSTDGKAVLGMSHHERLFRNAHSVLSPVENTAQWRAVKVKTSSAQAKPQCKENVENLAVDKRFRKSMLQEIRVDASLSNWIGGNAQHSGLSAPLLRTI